MHRRDRHPPCLCVSVVNRRSPEQHKTNRAGSAAEACSPARVFQAYRSDDGLHVPLLPFGPGGVGGPKPSGTWNTRKIPARSPQNNAQAKTQPYPFGWPAPPASRHPLGRSRPPRTPPHFVHRTGLACQRLHGKSAATDAGGVRSLAPFFLAVLRFTTEARRRGGARGEANAQFPQERIFEWNSGANSALAHLRVSVPPW